MNALWKRWRLPALLAAGMLLFSLTVAQAQLPANIGAQAAPIGGQTQQQRDWRYRWSNGRWWYYQPNNSWVVWNGNQWMTPMPRTALPSARQTPLSSMRRFASGQPTSGRMQQPLDWRYRWSNGRWWYFQPNNSWVFWNGNQWITPMPRTGRPSVTQAPLSGMRRYSYDPSPAADSYYQQNMRFPPGMAPMTSRNNSYSWPYTPFKKADSKVLGTNDY